MSARVHLFYGLAGSGKSTLAREIAREGGAVRFTLDKWMIRLFPHLSFDSDDYGLAVERVKETIWSIAEQTLATGTDVVLDWNSWSAERRRWARERAEPLGVEVTVHVLTTPCDVASRRSELRTASGHPYAHPVTRAGNEHLASLMEPPQCDEGLRIEEH